MAPSMGRRVAAEAIVETELASDEPNGEESAEILFALISAQWLAASTASSNEVVPEPSICLPYPSKPELSRR
ncbi:hypothetical protein VitviT2T_013418 [Vitis vinifera]|uniref:Uncharacterized protein n=1 Tax=Vitis vinifera TaxID=29760 RepID=A0ABY9CGQ8_VITVI|nr:hypothetical protein VitviT2T_013418 [Vitis vinifera]